MSAAEVAESLENVDNDQMPIGPAPPPAVDTPAFSEGKELPYETLNGYPMYQQLHVLDGRCQIFERIGWDDNLGATYLAMGPEDKELVVRIGNASNMIVKKEAGLLCKADQQNLWRYYSQVHSIWNTDDYMFLAIYFRDGPTLAQCWQFTKGKMDLGSAGRLAWDVLEILRVTHKLGYLARSLDFDAFHFDACSRHLFLGDISSVLLDSTKIPQFKDEKSSVKWIGGLTFAPLVTHEGEGIGTRDEMEAWFYQFVYMVKGALPWEADNYLDVKWNKIKAIESGNLFKDLPAQFKKIHEVITKHASEVAVSQEEYTELSALVIEIYRDVAGVTDHEENFTFEREPTPEELPRFVMEKVPTAGEEGEGVEEPKIAEDEPSEAATQFGEAPSETQPADK